MLMHVPKYTCAGLIALALVFLSPHSALAQNEAASAVRGSIKAYCDEEAAFGKMVDAATAQEAGAEADGSGRIAYLQKTLDAIAQRRGKIKERDADIDAAFQKFGFASNRAQGQGSDANGWLRTEKILRQERESCKLSYERNAQIEKRITLAEMELDNLSSAAEQRAEKDRVAKEKLERLTESVAVTAPLSERALKLDEQQGKEAAELFKLAHPTKFVFARINFDAGTVPSPNGRSFRPIPRGEAVLVRTTDGDRSAEIVTVDGENLRVQPRDLSVTPIPGTKVMPLLADWLAIVGPRTAEGGVRPDRGNYWDVFNADDTGFALDETPAVFGLTAAGDQRIDTFHVEREKISTCYDKQMDKLDPENRRQRFDSVTYDGAGKIAKVDSLTSKLDRKACAACGCKAFNTKKRALAKAILHPLQERAYAELQPILERVRSLFPTTKH
jgi:hypothetical protein